MLIKSPGTLRFRSPDLAQNGLAFQDFVRMSGKEAQKIDLPLGQFDFARAGNGFLGFRIDLPVGKGEGLGGFLFVPCGGPDAQTGRDAGAQLSD